MSGKIKVVLYWEIKRDDIHISTDLIRPVDQLDTKGPKYSLL